MPTTVRSSALPLVVCALLLVLQPHPAGAAVLPVPVEDGAGHWLSPGGELEERSRSITVTLHETSAVVEVRQIWFNPTRETITTAGALPLPSNATVLSASPSLVRRSGPAALETARRMALEARFPHLLASTDGAVWLSAGQTVQPFRHWGVSVTFVVPPFTAGRELLYAVPMADRGPPTAPLRRLSIRVRTVGGFARRLESLTHTFTPPAVEGRWLGFSLTGQDVSPEEDLLIVASLPPAEGQIRPIVADVADGTWLRARVALPPAPSPPRGTPAPSRGPLAVVFVIDTSGSMRGERIEAVSAGLDACLDALSTEDRFNVLPFSLIPRALHHEFLPVSAETRGQAHRYLAGLEAAGGTNLAETLQQAAEFAAAAPHGVARRILLVTDGKADVGMIEPARIDALWRQVLTPGTRLDVVALGSNVDFRLLASMVRRTGGRLRFVDDAASAAEAMVELVRTSRPALTDLSLSLQAAGLPVVFHATTASALFGDGPLLLAAQLPSGLSPSVELAVQATRRDGSAVTLADKAFTSAVSVPVDGVAEAVRTLETLPVVASLIESVEAPTELPPMARWKEARVRRILRLPSNEDEPAFMAELARASGAEVRDRHRMLDHLATWGTFLPRPVGDVLHRRAGSRMFLREGSGRWVEEPLERGTVPTLPYGGDEWCRMVDERPGLRKVLALGERVRFRDGTRLVEIVGR